MGLVAFPAGSFPAWWTAAFSVAGARSAAGTGATAAAVLLADLGLIVALVGGLVVTSFGSGDLVGAERHLIAAAAPCQAQRETTTEECTEQILTHRGLSQS